ncbi:MAG: hypothetical protein ABFS21_08850 [Actinomycetota bacterium]
MNDNVMRGRQPKGGARPPQTYSTERHCVHDGCTTKLSRYNRREYCYAHAPVKYPRLRGRVAGSEA